tara:strand:- start:413 stop:3067 length:2655 start_codon:yes stop_codon:yes gene_type:complete
LKLVLKKVSPRLGVLISLVSLAACASVVPEGSQEQGRQVQDVHGFSQAASDTLSVDYASAGTGETGEKDEDDDGLPSIASIVEDAELFEGFFDLYRSLSDGTVYLRIPTYRLEAELIYTATVTDGVVETGLFRGQYRDNKMIKLQRHFNRIDILQPNTRFYFDPRSALSRAADANAPDAVLAVMEIVAEDPASDDQPGAVLAKFSSVLLSEDLVQIKAAKRPGSSPGESLTLGKFSAARSRISSIASYPDNAMVYTDYVYELAAPLAFGGDDVTDARAITASVQHSFIKVPDNGYNPRFDDYRVGFFTDRVTDLTSRDPAPYRDVINRWNLVKKNPDQAISEPVEPITWWLENTTPLEFREMITKAALSWNSAFEVAGFRNAIVVKQQPDDADWDAGDIRYNVLRWTSSATPPFGGYGPRFTNPRTGQIIGADIMLEFAFLTNRLRIQDLLQPDDVMPTGTREHHCALAAQMQADVIFAQHALVSAGADAALSERLIEDSLYMLILHEIGHTLGLTHNMRASQLLPDVFDADAVAARGLSASVMDYEAVNVAPDGKTQTWFYQKRPGPYDHWALQYGYGEYSDTQLQQVLARSNEAELAYGNDADDMRSSNNGIDPHINIYDLSSDAIGYAEMRLAHLRTVQDRLPKQYQGKSYQGLVNAFASLMSQYRRSGGVVSRYVGGVHINREPPNSVETLPYTPVDVGEQRRAMQVLNTHLFAPDVLVGARSLFARLQRQRRGFDFYGEPEDPKIHKSLLRTQKSVLLHLLHANTLQRLTDTQTYGGEYSVIEMLKTLTDGIFAADLEEDVNSYRQNLQVEYVDMLVAAMSREANGHNIRAALFAQLLDLAEAIKSKIQGSDFASLSSATQAHSRYLEFILRKALAVDD